MTQRLFKLKGMLATETATGSVTVGGVEVFSGSFSPGADTEPDGYLCEFAHWIDNQYDWDLHAVDIMLPVIVTVTAGTVLVGMLKYNYARTPNPLLTASELAYINNGTMAIAPIAVKADVAAKGGWMVNSPAEFTYGRTPTTAHSNRTNVTVDGVALPNDAGHGYITLPAGRTLSFTTVVFSVPYQ
jgi:hypothetical protein